GGVEVEVVLLDVLAVVALVAGEPEQALLEDGIVAVPQRQGEAETLVVVRDAGQAVLAPAIGAGAGMIVREEFPRRAVRAVVLPDSAPLPLAQEWPPATPVRRPLLGLLESFFLGLHPPCSPHLPATFRPCPETLRQGAPPSQPPLNSLTPPAGCQDSRRTRSRPTRVAGRPEDPSCSNTFSPGCSGWSPPSWPWRW